MRHPAATLSITAALLLACQTGMAADFTPEKLTVESRIRPGSNLFAYNQNWSGASQVSVLSADDLSHKGGFSFGVVGQFALSADGKTGYAVSAYAKRITYGPTEGVLQEFDIATLTPRREIPLLTKIAQVAPSSSLLGLSTDGRFAYVQNATPATSISIVDLKAGKMTVEVPTPGCWGIYPSASGHRFSILCGDGTLASYQINDDGSASKPRRSAKIFDTDNSPLFIHAQRAGDDLLFTSFNGELYRIDDSGPVASLKEKYPYTQGVEGQWAPGGFAVLAYNQANNLLYITMHPNARNGSHKDAAKEIWALDLTRKKIVSRSPVDGIISITASAGKQPVLYGLNDEEGSITRYKADTQAEYRLNAETRSTGLGDFLVLALLGDGL